MVSESIPDLDVESVLFDLKRSLCPFDPIISCDTTRMLYLYERCLSHPTSHKRESF